MKKKLFVKTHGCQMNEYDSEKMLDLLSAEEQFMSTDNPEDADLLVLNTCSIRDKAEITIRNRLKSLNKLKKTKFNLKIGVLGCMAERLKKSLLEQEKIVDLVAGPDAYKDLPNLVKEVEDGRDAVNVILSKASWISHDFQTLLDL